MYKKITMSEKLDLGKKLRIIRKNDLKLSIKAFAEKFGYAESTIQKYEIGSRSIPFHVAVDLKKAFGISYDWWFDTEGKKKRPTEEKDSLIKDMRNLVNRLELAEQRIEKLEQDQKIMIRDLYANKHAV